MKIHLQITGGMGLTLRGTLESADLPCEATERVVALLTPENLRTAALSQPTPNAVDMREFEVTIAPDGDASSAEETNRYHFTESDDNIDVVDLLDELMREIVIRKQAG